MRKKVYHKLIFTQKPMNVFDIILKQKILLGCCLVLGVLIVSVIVLFPPSDSHSLINRNEFEYIISKPKCIEASNSSELLVVTLVQSKPQNVAQRDAIRKTWFHSDERMLFYFVLAASESEELQKQVKTENLRYKDIIQGNFPDSVENSIYKHGMTLKWFSNNCAEVKYLLKIDDDVFMNAPAVIGYLQSNNTNKSDIIGYRKRTQLQIRDEADKAPPNYFKYLTFPEYAMGFAVIYSNNFVNSAYPRLKQTRLTWDDDVLSLLLLLSPLFATYDDVYVSGIVRSQLKMNITAANDRYFHNTNESLENSINSNNSNFLFTFGGIDSDAMVSLWRQTHAENK